MYDVSMQRVIGTGTCSLYHGRLHMYAVTMQKASQCYAVVCACGKVWPLCIFAISCVIMWLAVAACCEPNLSLSFEPANLVSATARQCMLGFHLESTNAGWQGLLF